MIIYAGFVLMKQIIAHLALSAMHVLSAEAIIHWSVVDVFHVLCPSRDVQRNLRCVRDDHGAGQGTRREMSRMFPGNPKFLFRAPLSRGNVYIMIMALR